VEDTALLVDGTLQMITSSLDWPVIELGGNLRASDVWQI
jgi:hypothetical protein